MRRSTPAKGPNVAGAKFKTSIKASGPFFDHDPADTFRGNVHRMMLALAEEGAKDVRGQLQSGNSERAPIRSLGDHVSQHVTGELRKRPSGPGFSAFVFVKNRGLSKKEGTSLMAAASSLEGRLHVFRKTSGRIMRSRAANAAELVKGLT